MSFLDFNGLTHFKQKLDAFFAKINGYYEQMTVGNAEQIVSSVGIEDKVPYNFRTTGGSADVGDRVKLSEITGGTVAWHQFVKKHSEGWDYSFSYSGAISYDGDTVINTSASAQKIDIKTPVQITFVSGHKYFVSYDVKCSEANGIKTYFKYSLIDTTAVQANTWTRLTMIRTTSTNEKTFFDVVTQTAVSASGVTLSVKDINIIDLTQAFGSTIADYLYTLESGTAGAGIAKLKSWGFCTAPYYAYNAGSLLSVKTTAHKEVGFNQWDEQWEVGTISNSNGTNTPDTNKYRTKNYIPLVQGMSYYFKNGGNYTIGLRYYDADKNFFYSTAIATSAILTIPKGAAYLRFANTSANTYSNDICINLHWDGERDGEYEPYEEHSYPIDDVELRGIPKLDVNNNLYYDGDGYAPDGTVTRRYGIETFDGTEDGWNWYDAYNQASIALPIAGAYDAGKITYVCNKLTPISNNSRQQNIGNFAALISSGASVAFSAPNCDTLEKFKTWAGSNNLVFVYERATPTTESADPYQETQVCNDFGTEEFVGSRTVPMPVGANALYQTNLRAKLEMAPDSPDGDGDYIVRQSDGENTYVPLVIPTELPVNPSEDGTYILKVTVADGTATKTWVAEE